LQQDEQVIVWTSTLKRAVMTSAYLPSMYIFHQTTMLNEIYAGRCEGMTYGQVWAVCYIE
jgi:broad specificity phosphatase PhoE